MNKAVIFDEYYRAQQDLEADYGPQSIVLMMIGSFYEIYGVDLPNADPPLCIGKAEEARTILGMNMTLKSKARAHSGDNPFMVGFPDYALDEHIGKFLRANMTVAIYDQYDIVYKDKKGKQRTKKGRKRVHVYTPSTYIDDTLIEESSLLAFELVEYRSSITKQLLKKVHVAILCISTGKAHLLEAYDSKDDTGRAESELYRIIHTFNPSEIIYCGKPNPKFSNLYDLDGKKVYFREIPKTYRTANYQNEFLRMVYTCKSLMTPIEYIGMEKHSSVLPHFIQALQFAFEQNKMIVSRIQKPIFIESQEQLVLNNDSIYQLNLVKSPFEITNTLYDIICKARTAMGKRRIRERLLTPTMNTIVLNESYDLIEAMSQVYKEYDQKLCISDIEKKYRKMVLGTLHPYELADLRDTWSNIRHLLKHSQQLFQIPQELIEEFECFHNEYMGNFNFGVMKRCKINDIKGSFFLEGVNEELDDMENKLLQGKEVLYELAKIFSDWIEPEKDCTKVASTEKEGWYLSMTINRFKKLETLKNDFVATIDYHGKEYTINWDTLEVTKLTSRVKIRSPVIRRISSDILSHRERMNKKVTGEYLKVLEHYTRDYGDLFMKVSETIANIDFVYSAARVATEFGYVRPQIVDQQRGESYIEIHGIRHPIIEQINDTAEYITNDISIGDGEHYGSIVYGLNMSGKCFAKGTGILMATGESKMIEEIVVGDKIMGDDLTHRTVLELARGREKLYTITPEDGDSFTVTGGHVLCLMVKSDIDIEQQGNKFKVNWSSSGRMYSSLFGTMNDAFRYTFIIRDLSDTIEITVEDYFLQSAAFKEKYHLYTKPCDFPEQPVEIDPYLFGQQLGEGLYTRIPQDYKHNCRVIREQLLIGILESSGRFDSQELVDDTIWVANSVGYSPTRSFSITPSVVDDYYGFVLDGNHRFLLSDFTVSHNSSLLKSVGCNIVLAQAGMFVSCSKMQYFPFRNLLSKMTIRDNMSKGQSTFMVEMIEVKNMLMRADPNTLVLSDELCSSTESTSAHAIVAQTLYALTEKRAKFMFSTHLHELQNIPLVAKNPHIKIYHFKVHVDGKEINFDRNIEEGGMTALYGLEVARALGLPNSFMKGAFAVRDGLVGEPSEILTSKKSRYNSKLYVHKCSKCGTAFNLETNHIQPQKDADDNGLIGRKFHKNRKFNLEILCKQCHIKHTKYKTDFHIN